MGSLPCAAGPAAAPSPSHVPAPLLLQPPKAVQEAYAAFERSKDVAGQRKALDGLVQLLQADGSGAACLAVTKVRGPRWGLPKCSRALCRDSRGRGECGSKHTIPAPAAACRRRAQASLLHAVRVALDVKDAEQANQQVAALLTQAAEAAVHGVLRFKSAQLLVCGAALEGVGGAPLLAACRRKRLQQQPRG